MIFVTMLDVIPGKSEEVRKIVKNISYPSDIKMMEFLSLFGKPDYLIVFEAPDEEKAMTFILNFVSVAVPRTSLAVSIANP